MGFIGSIFDLFGGNPAQSEQNQFGQLAGYETNLGENLATPGAKFEEDILSGSPTLEAEALAPEISAARQQAQQNTNTLAEFAPRSGGTAAEQAGSRDALTGNILNLLGGLKSSTAANAVGQGEGFLGQAPSNLGNQAGLAIQNRQRKMGDIGSIAGGVASVALPFLEGGGGADPYETLYNAQHDNSGIETESPDLSGIGVS